LFNALLTFLTALAATLILLPPIIALTKRLKVRQTVLHYVKEHKGKSGTPTMGGAAFILALPTCLIFAKGDKTLLLVALAVTVGYGIVGFLDDFIKVFYRRNEGLSAWQKIVFQLLIAVTVSLFAYFSGYVGDSVYSFFGFNEYKFGWLAIPLYVVIFLALTNSVNLTDGLDGLAGGITLVYALFFAAIMGLYIVFDGGQALEETQNLIFLCMALAGGLLGFLCFNSYPAKIFMGDTGALALGGALASLAVFSKRVLIVPLLGIAYVMTALSVIIQVLYYKKTKKRVFLMAPIHHHFQQKGVHESKIGFLYTAVTSVVGVILLIIFFAVNG